MKRYALLALSVLFLSTAAVAQNSVDVSIEADSDSYYPGDVADIEIEVEGSDSVEGNEVLYISGDEAERYDDTTLSSTESEFDIPYVEEGYGEKIDHYGLWALGFEYEDDYEYVSFEVEPRSTLDDINSPSGDDSLPVVTDTSDERLVELAEVFEYYFDDVELIDHTETVSSDHDEIVVLGSPDSNEFTEEHSQMVGEIYSLDQFEESGVSNIAVTSFEDGTVLTLSGNSYDAVERSSAIFEGLLNQDLNVYFEDEVSATVTEDEYEAMVSGEGSFDVEVLDEPQGYEGESPVFELRGINTHPADVEGEITFTHATEGETWSESDSFSFDAGESDVGEIESDLDLQSGQNSLEIVFDPENYGAEVIEREYQIGEPDIDVSTNITHAVEGEALELVTGVENSQSYDYSGAIQFEHFVDGELVESEDSVFEIEADTERYETDSISAAESGENIVVITVYDSQEQEVTSTSESVEIGEASPGVSIDGDLDEERLRVVSTIERVEEFENAEVELNYLKDGDVIGDYSPSVSRHGDEFVEETPVDELRQEVIAETGDSSLSGQHMFTIDVLQDGEVLGSDEDSMTYEENRDLDVLRPGWTMVSGDMGLTELEAYCSITEFQGEKVWQITGDEWSHPEDLESHRGYYVHIEDRCEAPLAESSDLDVGEEADLEDGWNMISTYTERSFNDLDTDCELVEDSNGDSIWIYNSIANSWDTGDESDDLEPGRGYFVNVESDCSIEFGAVDAPPTPTGNFFGGER